MARHCGHALVGTDGVELAARTVGGGSVGFDGTAVHCAAAVGPR